MIYEAKIKTRECIPCHPLVPSSTDLPTSLWLSNSSLACLYTTLRFFCYTWAWGGDSIFVSFSRSGRPSLWEQTFLGSENIGARFQLKCIMDTPVMRHLKSPLLWQLSWDALITSYICTSDLPAHFRNWQSTSFMYTGQFWLQEQNFLMLGCVLWETTAWRARSQHH